MKIKKVIDNKIVVEWYDFEKEKSYGGIIMPEYLMKDVRGNNGKVLMIGQDVKDIEIGDVVMYAVGTIYLPIETDDGKVIIIPRDDVIAIIEE